MVIAVHLVLRSDLPRRMIVDRLSQETGLVISIDALRSDWGGETRVHGLSVRLPLESGSFLEVGEITLRHRGVVRLLLTRGLGLSRVEMDSPVVVLEQRADGGLNIERVARQLAASPIGRSGAGDGSMALPHVHIRNASLRVTRHGAAPQVHAPIGFSGEPVDAGAWSFMVDWPAIRRLEGRLAPQAPWRHDVQFDLAGIEALLRDWIEDLPGPVHLRGRWHGALEDGALAGHLMLEQADAGGVSLTGDADLRMARSALILHPRGLRLVVADSGMPAVTIDGGRIATDGRSVSVSRAVVQGGTVVAHVSIDHALESAAGTFDVAWRGADTASGVAHAGEVRGEISLPALGRKTIRAHISGSAADRLGSVAGDLDLELAGRTFGALEGRLLARRLEVRHEHGSLALDGLDLGLAAAWPELSVARVSLPGAPVSGRAVVHAQTRAWSASFRADGWEIGALHPDLPAGPLHTAVVARGDRAEVRFERVTVSQGDIRLTGTGVYRMDGADDPLTFESEIRTALRPTDAMPVAGRAQLTVRGTGRVHPIGIELDGAVTWQDLVVVDRPVPPAEIAWSGHLAADALQVRTPRLDLFGGHWSAEGHYERTSGTIRARARSGNSSLARLLEVAQVPLAMQGSVAAEVEIDLPGLDLERLRVEGAWSAEAVSGPAVARAEAEGRVRIDGRRVVLDGMRVTQDDGTLEGEARLRLDAPHEITVVLRADRWAVAHADTGVTGHVDGSAALAVDLRGPGATGSLDLSGALAVGEASIGSFQVRGAMEGRTIVLPTIVLDGPIGHVHGDARLVLSQSAWMESHVHLAWRDVDLASIPLSLPITHAPVGRSEGSLRIARATDPRASEPMAITVETGTREGAFGPVAFDRLGLTGSVGLSRLVVDRAVLHAADGTVTLWGRLTRHGDEPSFHAHVQFDDVDLDQVAGLFSLSGDPVPGRVSGSIALGGNPVSLDRLFGQGRAHLRASELVGLPGFEQLYRLVRLDFSRDEPSGEGDAEIRIEGGSVEISRLTYFNRGTDIVARLSIEAFREGASSAISGVAVAAVRPLRDMRIPILARLDRLLSAVQSSASSIRIHGTLAEPAVEVIPFAEVGGAIRRILTGSAG
ncbi:MAG: hypothetical protein KF817_04975 [Phycisphaeraceae bacterium]|nr:hypothetical protein [Phycisphaeraceae bacterium]